MSGEARILSATVPLVEEWRALESVRKAFQIAASPYAKWSSSWNDSVVELRFDGETVIEVNYNFESRIFVEALAHRLNNSTIGMASQ